MLLWGEFVFASSLLVTCAYILLRIFANRHRAPEINLYSTSRILLFDISVIFRRFAPLYSNTSDRFKWRRSTLAAVSSVPFLAARTSIVRGHSQSRYARRGRRIWRRVQGEGLKTRVHARTLGEDRSKEQERPNLKIISGSAEINRANIVRVCEREKERGKNERKKKKEGKRETGHKRSELRLALPRRKRERSLEAWVTVVVAAIMNLALHKRKRNDERHVQVSVLWIILLSSYRLSESYFGDFPWKDRVISKCSDGVFRLCFFLTRDAEAKLTIFLFLFWHWKN